MKIGDRIRIARERRGITQSDLAQQIGVRAQSVQQWESGSTEPRPKRIQAIATVLKIYEVWLQTGSGPQDAEQDTGPRDGFQATLTAEELTLIEKYRRMDPESRAAFQQIGYIIADKPRPTWSGQERRQIDNINFPIERRKRFQPPANS